MSVSDSTHSSEYPQRPHKYRVTVTEEKIVLPTGMTLPLPYAPTFPGIRMMSADAHFVHFPLFLLVGLMSEKCHNGREQMQQK